LIAEQLRPLAELLGHFAIFGDLVSLEPFGTGHINTTYRSTWFQAGTRVRYIHQRINATVFTKPPEVLSNIGRVTDHIRAQLVTRGVDQVSRRVLTLVPTLDGRYWLRDSQDAWWRTYLFIEGSTSRESCSGFREAEALGRAIGDFQNQVADLRGDRLFETIPHFHDSSHRYGQLEDALRDGDRSRIHETKDELAFLAENRERGTLISRKLAEGSLPERICHNDTKMNNLLLDEVDGEVLCVADLDTVMPGSPLYDFGDLVRTATSTAEEDERDLSRMGFSLPLFEALLSGYAAAASFLCAEERALLCEAGRSTAQIMAIRFLTDYLNGDRYYKIAWPSHNLDRCRTQIAFMRSMDTQWAAVKDCASRILESIALGDRSNG